MATERKKLGFEKFLSLYFSNFGKFTLVNLIFAVPLCVAFAICFCICKFLLPQAATFILPLSVVLAAPFYSGVVVVSRNIYYDNLTFGIFSEYVDAVKENYKAFIVHGVVAYIAFIGCYHGAVIYNYLASVSPVFYVMFFVSLIIALFLLFILFAAPLMSASFDLGLKDVYKNSALMTFGEIKANLLATVGNLACLAVLSFPLMFFFNLTSVWGVTTTAVVLYVYLAVVVVFLLPSALSSITTACLYPDMKRVISGEAKKNLEEIRRENEEEERKAHEPEAAEFSDADIESIRKSTGEYVFYQGKMIKRSVILKEIEESEDIKNG